LLEAVGPAVQTVTFDPEGEDVVMIGKIRDREVLKKAVAKEINLSKQPEMVENAELWRSEDGEIAAAIIDEHVFLGDAESVRRCLKARNSGTNLSTIAANSGLGDPKTPIVTIGTEADPAARLVEVLGEKRSEETPLIQEYVIRTSFNKNTIDRVTTSDFGMIGLIIEQFKAE
jgi:hypothetical protein